MEGSEQPENGQKCNENKDSRGSEHPDSTNLDSTAGSNGNCCNICGETFISKTHLTEHLLIHTDEKKFKCEVCGKAFIDASHLRTHMIVHTGEKAFTCEVCGKEYSSKRNVKRHMSIHMGEKIFRCEVCGNKFLLHSELRWHMSFHSKGKEHKCKTCGRAFLRRGDLDKHISTHTGIKKFKCNSCDKVFSRSSNLLSHKLLHSEVKKYECEICKKKFLHKTGLNQHAPVHTGTRNFKCEICGKMFARNSFLTKHLEYHKGIKNFKCGTCQMFFSQKGNVKMHIKRRHEGVGTIITYPENVMTVVNTPVCKTDGKSRISSKAFQRPEDLASNSVTTATGYKNCQRTIQSPSSADASCNVPVENDSRNDSWSNSEEYSNYYRAKHDYCKKLRSQGMSQNICYDIPDPVSDEDLEIENAMDHVSDTSVGMSNICDGDCINDDNLVPVPGGFEYISPNQTTGTSTSGDTDNGRKDDS